MNWYKIAQQYFHQEAKKYNNVDDFIASFGSPFYHGTASKFDEFKNFTERHGFFMEFQMFCRFCDFTTNRFRHSASSGDSTGNFTELPIIDLPNFKGFHNMFTELRKISQSFASTVVDLFSQLPSPHSPRAQFCKVF